jgi:hypothetical protein
MVRMNIPTRDEDISMASNGTTCELWCRYEQSSWMSCKVSRQTG